jgi:hypothetical protein
VVTQAWRAFEGLLHHPSLLLALIAQNVLGALVEARRLVLLTRSQQIRLPFLRSLRLVLMAVPFGYVVPGGVGGDVIKVYELALEHVTRRVELAAVVMVDRITGMLSMLTVALVAALCFGSPASAPARLQALMVAASLGIIGTVTVLLLTWSPLVRASREYRAVISWLPFHRVLVRGLDALYAFRDHKLAVLGAVAVSAASNVTLMGVFILAARTFMPDASGGLVAWVSLIALVANAIPLTPGGLGVGEAAFAGAFRLAGFAGGAQLLLAWRAGLVPLAITGGLLYALSGRRYRGSVKQVEGFDG